MPKTYAREYQEIAKGPKERIIGLMLGKANVSIVFLLFLVVLLCKIPG